MDHEKLELKKRLSRHIANESTGQSVSLPGFVQFICLASVVAASRAFLLPMLSVVLMMVGLAWSSGATEFFSWCAVVFLIACLSLMTMTASFASELSADGLIDDYMSMICAKLLVPRWLAERFGRVL